MQSIQFVIHTVLVISFFLILNKLVYVFINMSLMSLNVCFHKF